MKNKGLFFYLEKLSEFWAGVVILLSLLSLGAIIGGILYSFIQGQIGLAILVLCIVVFLFIGVRVVRKHYRGKGTVHLLSRSMASPELDDEVH